MSETIHDGYVLVTPARNEEANLERTIASVAAQTIRPRRWVIVSDGSTDATDAIAAEAAARHDFIILLRAGGDGQANFGSKVRAFQAGCRELTDVPYAFIGNLDADVTFAPDYFERLLARFADDGRLGLAGGDVLEKINGHFLRRRVSPTSVAGAVQLFRRACFEQIGGYQPQTAGGIDSIAEIRARMHGWRTRNWGDLEVLHHGRVTGRKGGILRQRFYKGVVNYLLGYHPLFHLLSSLSRLRDRPWLAGGALMIAGYGWAAARRLERQVDRDFVRFIRREQMERLYRRLIFNE